MTVNLSALAGAGQQFFNNRGVVLTGGKLYSYAAGTTTPQTCYTTAAGNVAHANPIILDSSGRVATGEIWLTAGSNYKFVLTDSNDVLIATWDNITGINGTGIASNASNVQYDPAGTGAVSTTVQAKLRQTISVKDFGAVGNGIADDSTAVQNALNYLTTVGGGTLLMPGTFLVGGLVVNSENINFVGNSTADQIIVKNGTTGIWVKQNFVNFQNITIISQGTKTDGLGTNGVLYEKGTAGSPSSVGFVFNQNVNIKNFSGYGMRVSNAINFAMKRVYVVSCVTGIEFYRLGVSVSSFSTTVDFENVYVTSCTTGILGARVYRSRFNVIAEYCTYGMDMNIGDFTLYRCYFEKNATLGARVVDCTCQDLWCYNNNATTDAVSITFTGAVAASDRGYVLADDFNWLAKRLGVLSGYGVDPLYFASYGTASNTGLKWGSNTVALVRGENLLNNAAWNGNTGTANDFIGWDNLNQGFKVAGTVGSGGTNDPYGITQNIVLINTKKYVIDLNVTNVAGSGITTIKVGNDIVTNGVAFTPTASGSQAVKCIGADVTGTVYESYVNSFTLAEVLADQTQIAEANDRLTRQKTGRGVSYAAAAPSTGRWMQGEIVYNTAPTAGGFVGWVCTASGSPGTWKTFGAISV